MYSNKGTGGSARKVPDSEKTSVSKALEDCREYFISRKINASFEPSQKPGYVVLNVGAGVRIIYNYKKLRKFSLHTHYRQQVIVVGPTVAKTAEEIVAEADKNPDMYPFKTGHIDEQRGKPDETREEDIFTNIVMMYTGVASRMQRAGRQPVAKQDESPYEASFRQRRDTEIDTSLEQRIIGIPVMRNNITRKIKLSELSHCMDPQTGQGYNQESLEDTLMTALGTQAHELEPIDYHSILLLNDKLVIDLGDKKIIAPYLKSTTKQPTDDDKSLVLDRFRRLIYNKAATISDEKEREEFVISMRHGLEQQSNRFAAMLRFLADNKERITVYELMRTLDKDNIGPFLNYVFPEHGTIVIGHADSTTAPLIIEYVAKMRGSVPFEKAIDRNRYCIRVNSRTIYFTGKYARKAFSDYANNVEKKTEQALADDVLAVMDGRPAAVPEPVPVPDDSPVPQAVDDSGQQYQTRAFVPEQQPARIRHVIVGEPGQQPQPAAPAPVRPHTERVREPTRAYGVPAIDPNKDYDTLMKEIDARLGEISENDVTDINGKKK